MQRASMITALIVDRKGLKCQYRRPRFALHHARPIEGIPGVYQSLDSESELNPTVRPWLVCSDFLKFYSPRTH
jgi:hypothetical protein